MVGYSENREEDFSYNPTAHLAGFILKFADKDSGLYKKAVEIAKQAYEWFVSKTPVGDDYIAHGLMRLYEYLSETGLELVDMRTFAEKLQEEINNDICRDTERWITEYVCRPSMFINNNESMFFENNKELVQKECELLAKAQLKDGSYTVPWAWYNDYAEYTLSANWWKSVLLITYMRFLKEFG